MSDASAPEPTLREGDRREVDMLSMKHLQKYTEKKPRKKKTRRITVRITVIGEEIPKSRGGGVGFIETAWTEEIRNSLKGWPEGSLFRPLVLRTDEKNRAEEDNGGKKKEGNFLSWNSSNMFCGNRKRETRRHVKVYVTVSI